MHLIKNNKVKNIKAKLEKTYSLFNFEEAVKKDPIRFPKKYKEPLDIEVSAFIAASFAYGNIKCFSNFLEKLFNIMGNHPADFIMNFNPKKLIKNLEIKYRFNSIHDIVAFFYIIQNLLKKYNSFEEVFYNKNLKSQEISKPFIIFGISNFVNESLKTDVSLIYNANIKTKGLIHFFPDPSKGSSCKRINLFLRWMVRNRDVDFGLWKKIKPFELVIPLDIHIFNISRKLGITKRNIPNMKTAIEITEFFKKINPEDPLKYDFVLCHRDMEKLMLLE